MAVCSLICHGNPLFGVKLEISNSYYLCGRAALCLASRDDSLLELTLLFDE